MATNDFEELFQRYAAALITYIEPFRIISSDRLSVWGPTLDEINTSSWDRLALHEIAGRIDVGLPPPGDMLVCRDGALVLPPHPSILNETAAVVYFNMCLGALLIGGVYCEAVALDSVEFGFVLDWTYVRSYQTGTSASTRFHRDIRAGESSPTEAISLLNP